MVYAICNDFYPTLEKKLNRISKKCVKNGNPFVFQKIGEEVRKIHKNDKTCILFTMRKRTTGSR